MERGELFPNVKSVLIVLSSKAMCFDMFSLKNFIAQSYPGAAVAFMSTSGDFVGAEAPLPVDLLIDLTPPSARQGFFFARKLKSISKYQVGRDSGWFFRKKFYTRIFDEKLEAMQGLLPKDMIAQERYVQRKVMALAGLDMRVHGGVVPDLSRDIGKPFLNP